METTEILEKIYALSTESKLADERIEVHFVQMDKRIETLEKLSQTMAENLNDLKHIQSIVDQLTNKVTSNTNEIENIKQKFIELEQSPIKESASKWQQITDAFFKALIGACVGYLCFRFGIPTGE